MLHQQGGNAGAAGTSSECDCFLDYMFQRRPLSRQGHSQFELATFHRPAAH